jgi:hypothetical protein
MLEGIQVQHKHAELLRYLAHRWLNNPNMQKPGEAVFHLIQDPQVIGLAAKYQQKYQP